MMNRGLFLYYCLWQEPDIGQDLQLPQLHTIDCPRFLFLSILMIIAATTAISTAQMMMAPIFSVIHVNILSSPLGDQCASFAFLENFR